MEPIPGAVGAGADTGHQIVRSLSTRARAFLDRADYRRFRAYVRSRH
jgi:hypothetical protein